MRDNTKLVGVASGTAYVEVEEMDQQRLLGMFPMVVWRLVFGYLENDDKTLENLSNASLFFRQELKSRRTKYLFPKVLDMLHSILNLGATESFGNETIMTLRLVCRKWNESIERVWEKNCEGYTPENHICLVDESHASKFLSHFKATHPVGGGAGSKSPFVDRSIYLDLSEADYDDVTALLKAYGSHILFASIDTFMDGQHNNGSTQDNTNEIYICLSNWLSLMPNLKVLHFDLYFLAANREAYNCETLLPLVERLPLPVLNSLCKLDLRYIPGPIVNSMLEKWGEKITGLFIHQIKTPLQNIASLLVNWDINPTVFARLQLQELEIYYKNDNINLEVFEQMLVAGSENLVSFKLVSYKFYINWFKIFETLSRRWAKTLKHLYLYMPDNGRAEDELSNAFGKNNENRFGLEKLKYLKIWVGGKEVKLCKCRIQCLIQSSQT